ncbi:lysozyme inhibitor LprI family protein [Kaistia soli]|nr:lysozyme inhibitor LprI family protein [Kaistia soli]
MMGTERTRGIVLGMLGLAVIAVAAALPYKAEAASFNCAKAAQPDEVAICAHRDLNDDDVEMATRYQMLLKLVAMGTAGDMRDDQKAWLSWRRSCGSDVACLGNAYQDRIGALKAAFDRIAARGPF